MQQNEGTDIDIHFLYNICCLHVCITPGGRLQKYIKINMQNKYFRVLNDQKGFFTGFIFIDINCN